MYRGLIKFECALVTIFSLQSVLSSGALHASRGQHHHKHVKGEHVNHGHLTTGHLTHGHLTHGQMSHGHLPHDRPHRSTLSLKDPNNGSYCHAGNSSCQLSDDASLSRLVTFSPDYNVLEHPPTGDGEDDAPLAVGFQINLRNLLEVNEVSQICSLETTIRIYWEDK